ncbi:hypothetical protein LTR53_001554 [Teratosphaeriaceae sp. CCFEE 6253]|nr:hypothetical protein LTR53_001554 [Teratosphaeriaceae sp. CCFEE 6253]
MSNSTITSSSADPSSSAAASSLASAVSSSIAAAVSSSIITEQGSTVTVEPSTTNIITSTISAASLAPTTNIVTSVVTQSAVSNGVTDTNPVTVVVTSVNSNPGSTTNIIVTAPETTSATKTSSTPTPLSGGSSDGSSGTGAAHSGLTTGAKTAIAVVIPVAFVALLVGLGIWFWRRRKQTKDNREQRRKEIDEYGYNPNSDPTLPPVAASEAGGAPQMTQDSSGGYRGWGGAVAGMAGNRKPSTTLSGGHTQGQLSESGGSYGEDGHSGDPLVHQRDTMGSDELGALGAGPAIAAAGSGMRRGPSNASSAYSAGARSDGSDEPAVPPLPQQPYDISPVGAGAGAAGGYGYGQHGPYGDGSYGGGEGAGGMPVVRDVSARRNTRVQQAQGYGQGNSGIAQNF